MTRIVITVLLAAVAGVAFGRLQSRWMHHGYEERFISARATDAELKGDQVAVTQLRDAKGTPRVEVVGGTDYDFGVMQHGDTLSKEFVFRNIGDGPLSLNMGGSTCKCTVGELDRSVLQPGEETVVKLTWTANTVLADFGQTATIVTNDPLQPEVQLTVHGRVAEKYVLVPEELSLGTIPTARPTRAKFHFFNYSKQQVSFEDMIWSDDATRPYVELSSRLIPLDPAAFPKHKNATSVHEILLEIKPGMPTGPLSSRIQIFSNLEVLTGAIEYRVTGNVVGDVTLVGGASFDPKLNLLKIGTVDPSEGAEVSIFVSLHGDKKDAPVSVESIVPDESLDVEIGEGREVRDRRVVPVKFVVPKGAPPVYYPANSKGRYGKVILSVGGPSPEQIVIFVRLNVPDKGQ
ncbi:MAG: DUF1573 domain-containing protein [Planctomycetota bacterium]|nr:MAG: DUF1573 domain-containing protein [Planctomycetota bacterium]